MLSNIGPVGPGPAVFDAVDSKGQNRMNGEGPKDLAEDDTLDYDSVLVAGRLKGW